MRLAFIFILFLLTFSLPASAETVGSGSDALELGQEYGEHSVGRSGGRNPVPSKSRINDRTIFERVLYYLPNRIIDFIDIFKADVGVGPSFGGVVRLTKYGQVGYRNMMPASLRVGLRGRDLPVFVENSNEFGVGPAFIQSSDREVSPIEVGLGADLLLVGGYVGLSVDEAFDFLFGIVGIDFKDDDLL